MPRYDFKCAVCGNMELDRILPITHGPDDRPSCCGYIMDQHFTVPPQVHWIDPVIEPFRHIATPDRPVITSTKQNREYMARNNLVDANDLGVPPDQRKQMKEVAKMKESIKAISPTAEQESQLQEQGLDSIL